MVGVLEVAGLLILLFVNSAITALLTRFLRVRLDTRWGSLVYVLLFSPIALLAVTMVVSGAFGLGPNLGSPTAVVGLTVVVPMALGITFDYVWMPAPDEVELPDQYERGRVRR